MEGEFFKGDIKDVCAELKAEAERHKGMKVGKWLSFRKLKRIVDDQIADIVKGLEGERE